MTVVIKQYGAKRTGTNVLRELLYRNTADTMVLMHVLGDKHSEPVDLDGLRRAFPEASSWEFVERATLAAPAVSTDPVDTSQRNHLRAISPTVMTALREGSLKFTISARAPASWLNAMAVSEQWAWTVSSVDDLMERLVWTCQLFNRLYSGYLRLVEKMPSRCRIVRIEELSREPAQVVHDLAVDFGLRMRYTSVRPVAGYIFPADWDTSPTTEIPTSAWRRPSFESDGLVHAVVARAVDKGILRDLGYEDDVDCSTPAHDGDAAGGDATPQETREWLDP